MKHRKKIACIYIPHIIAELEKSRYLFRKPVIVATGLSEEDTIIDFAPSLKHRIKGASSIEDKLSRGVPLGKLGKITWLSTVAEILTPDYEFIERATEGIQDILEDFSPVVEYEKYTRFYLDLTGTEHIFGRTIDTVGRILRLLHSRFKITVKGGIGNNILTASTAALMAGHLGVYEIAPLSEKTFIGQTNISLIPLLPDNIKKYLRDYYNITSTGELSALSKAEILSLSRSYGPVIYSISRARSRDILLPEGHKKGIKHRIILNPELNDSEVKKAVLESLFSITKKLLARNTSPSRYYIYVTYADSYRYRGTGRLKSSTIGAKELFGYILPHLNRALARRTGIKEVFLFLTGLKKTADQPYLFPENSENKLERTISSLATRYGKKYIRYGT